MNAPREPARSGPAVAVPHLPSVRAHRARAGLAGPRADEWLAALAADAHHAHPRVRHRAIRALALAGARAAPTLAAVAAREDEPRAVRLSAFTTLHARGAPAQLPALAAIARDATDEWARAQAAGVIESILLRHADALQRSGDAPPVAPEALDAALAVLDDAAYTRVAYATLAAGGALPDATLPRLLAACDGPERAMAVRVAADLVRRRTALDLCVRVLARGLEAPAPDDRVYAYLMLAELAVVRPEALAAMARALATEWSAYVVPEALSAYASTYERIAEAGTPVTELARWIANDGRPPLSWAVAHAPEGDLAALLARWWNDCPCGNPLIWLLVALDDWRGAVRAITACERAALPDGSAGAELLRDIAHLEQLVAGARTAAEALAALDRWSAARAPHPISAAASPCLSEARIALRSSAGLARHSPATASRLLGTLLARGDLAQIEQVAPRAARALADAIRAAVPAPTRLP